MNVGNFNLKRLHFCCIDPTLLLYSFPEDFRERSRTEFHFKIFNRPIKILLQTICNGFNICKSLSFMLYGNKNIIQRMTKIKGYTKIGIIIHLAFLMRFFGIDCCMRFLSYSGIHNIFSESRWRISLYWDRIAIKKRHVFIDTFK